MTQDTRVSAVAHVIQLAVAPVFLLSAIGAILNVLTGRLGRIFDRARVLEAVALKTWPEVRDPVSTELSTLARRARWISRSITLCTVTACLICAVIVVLFVGAFLNRDTSPEVAALFVGSMVVFLIALLLFLREILLATATLRIGLEHVPPPAGSAGAKAPD
jgi:hypothetical protein